MVFPQRQKSVSSVCLIIHDIRQPMNIFFWYPLVNLLCGDQKIYQCQRFRYCYLLHMGQSIHEWTK